jgi:undecaprenyl-diphosphatase
MEPWLQIVVLGIVQGLAELLPVSSSAHVIIAQKFLGLDPTSPDRTFLLVMLHTGTMFAVLLYFWKKWTITRDYVKQLFVATMVTGVLGLGLKEFIERVVLAGHPKPEIELLFGKLPLIATALATVGLIILYAGVREPGIQPKRELTTRSAGWIGAIQGICLPFRGFSRSGATISVAMLLGIPRLRAEEFSFALAVILTPPVIVLEAHRLAEATSYHVTNFVPGLFGMICSFLAGLVALRILSDWLERGRWKYFGIYNLCAAAAIFLLHRFVF